MNERIKELSKQAGDYVNETYTEFWGYTGENA